MKRFGTLLIITVVICEMLQAQNPRESFQEFRSGLHRDYQKFRAHIKEQYADFLAGEWHPYEPLRTADKYTQPKPKTAPVKTGTQGTMPQNMGNGGYEGRVSDDNDRSKGTETGIRDSGIDFYGVRIEVPKIEFNILRNISSSGQAPGQWKKLMEGSASEYAMKLHDACKGMGFNGYLTFRLAQVCVNEKFPEATPLSRMSAVHYLLVAMGYDARLAVLENGEPLLLLPFEQKVYGSAYLNIDGRDYTVFGLSIDSSPALSGEQIFTCSLPRSGDVGDKMDLRLTGLKLPYKPHRFRISANGLTLEGELNENLFGMIYHYPQMPTEDFASSVLDPELRRSICESVRSQLSCENKEESVNKLLRFFHQGFPYATDEERHGFEKPYFLEETLFYDKCDCEDRAIMFTWLLWNALGIESQLIAYPMHESAAVNIPVSTDKGSGYTYKGKRYWSADPTYIGSSVGDVMPQFSGVAPKVDKTYGLSDRYSEKPKLEN